MSTLSAVGIGSRAYNSSKKKQANMLQYVQESARVLKGISVVVAMIITAKQKISPRAIQDLNKKNTCNEH